jgi:hypothetical protein|uniref:hypothetical protein n=1 Tax=unclassified Variovorax TaxID=663243 RepID=UPI000D398CA6
MKTGFPGAVGAVAVAAALWAGSAQADYLWLQKEPATGGASVHAGELRKPLAALPALAQPKALLPDGQPLPVTARADAFDVALPAGTPDGDLRFTATRLGDKGVLTYFQSRYGRAGTQAVNDFELVPTTPGGNTFKLMFKGRAVSASQVNVDTAEGWRRQLAPDADGSVTLGTPFPGLYVLEVTARVDNGAVTLDGKKYDDVRHTATLSFEVKP